jgi:hypothetical protein
MSDNSDVAALLLICICFGGFIFVAGATTNQNQTYEETVLTNLYVFWHTPLLTGGVPNSDAQRLADAYTDYGQPIYIVISNQANSNLGVAQNTYPQVLIDYFHSYGLKCMIWIHSMGTNIAPSTGYSLATVEAQVDAQISWGDHIDAFNVDEVNDGGLPNGGSDVGEAANLTYYTDLAAYIRAAGTYIVSFNAGQRDVSDALCVIPDFLCLESCYYWFATEPGNHIGKTDYYTHAVNLVATYPTKFWGVLADWYIWERCAVNGGGSGGSTWLYSDYIQDVVGAFAVADYDLWAALTENQFEAAILNIIQEANTIGVPNFSWDFEPVNDEPVAAPTGSAAGSGLPSWYESYLLNNLATLGTLEYPIVVMSVSDSTIITDEPVSATATLTGGLGAVTGTVTFYRSADAVTWTQLGLATTLTAGAATSINYQPGLVGYTYFYVAYSGDVNYNVVSSGNVATVVSAPNMLGVLGRILTQMENY